MALVEDLAHEGEKKLDYGRRVLELLIPLKPDDDLVIATLVYPLYLVGKISDEQLSKYGSEVVSIVLGVRKLDELDYVASDKHTQVEVLRKMYLSMAKDLRCIVMSLAFRLDRLQNVAALIGAESAATIAKETLDLYVPIAERLGVYRIKTKMEDLAFQYAYPQEYQELKKQLDELGNIHLPVIKHISEDLKKFVQEQGLVAEVSGRVKSVYSIYRKMKRKNLSSIDGLYDIFAMRIIFPSQYDSAGNERVDYLYSFIGMLHSSWKPVSKRFKDYIALPKPNGYRSLHTVVLGLAPKGSDQPVEIQVRSEAMHNEAEFGVASHWLYKSMGGASGSIFSSQIEWLRCLERLSTNMAENDGDLAGEVELDLFKDRIFVLTPRGEVKDLPAGSCPIDFAYSVHTDVGNRCMMAKVNSSVVPLDYELQNGDVVQIVTRKDAEPKLQWLSLVKSSGARNKIKAWFGQLNRENNIREGRRLLNSQLARLGKPALDQNYTILRDFDGERLTLSRRETLVEEVGKGTKLVNDVIRKIYPYEDIMTDRRTKVVAYESKKSGKDNVAMEEKILVDGEGGISLKIAACCSPRQGNKIAAYVTSDGKVSIHQQGCTLFKNLNDNKKMSANWIDEQKSANYRVKIKVKAVSRVGLMSDLTSIMSIMGISIESVDIKPDTGKINDDYFVLVFSDLDQFDVLINKLEHVDGVINVQRVA